MEQNTNRCPWALQDDLSRIYHDTQWGIPEYDDKKLFKMLMLEGMQAGLSWALILKKMDTLCEAFDDFDPAILITYDDAKKAALLQNDGVIKNRLKINAMVHNAHVYFKICETYGSFSNYIWGFVNGKPIVNHWKTAEEVPATTELSDKMSKDLKKQGFKFVGSTTVYAYMQACGIVNDHLTSCAFFDVANAKK